MSGSYRMRQPVKSSSPRSTALVGMAIVTHSVRCRSGTLYHNRRDHRLMVRRRSSKVFFEISSLRDFPPFISPTLVSLLLKVRYIQWYEQCTFESVACINCFTCSAYILLVTYFLRFFTFGALDFEASLQTQFLTNCKG